MAAAVTHAHPDHIGTVGQLLSLYPEAKVVTHVEEMKNVAGPHPASHFQGGGLVKKLFKAAA